MIDPWQEKIKEYFNKQEGQNYPCSNQIVLNDFITNDKSKWEKFLKDNKDKIIKKRENEIVLNNNERWYYYGNLSGSIIGYRFYKVKVDKTLDKKFITECILPCCALYCCEFEWI